MAWIDVEQERPFAKGALVDETQRVVFRDYTRADRCKRQIIEAIEACDDPDALADYVLAETPVLDGLQSYSADMHAEIVQAAQDHRACLIAGRNSMKRAVARSSEHGGTVQNTERKPQMAANPDFKKVVQKDVTFLWPRLDQTYRYNNAKKASEPADPGMQGAAWSLSWELDADAAKELTAELRAHYEDCRSRNSKLPEFSTIFGAKSLTDEDGKPTGKVKFSAKKNGMSNAGKMNKPPRVVGTDLQELADKAIWTGSSGHIRALAFATTDADGRGGISMLLDAVQVLEAAYGGDNLEDDFGPAQPNFGDDIQKRTEAAASAPVPEAATVDDDLPF